MKLPLDVPVAGGRPFIELAREIATAILRTIESGWALALTSTNVKPNDGEVEMTERLRDAMRRAVGFGTVGWNSKMVVLPGTESRSRRDVLKPDGRTDIPILVIGIFLRFGDHDPHAIVECKRIAGSDTYLCREYVVEGIDRFGTGKYSGHHSTGFMIGYLISGNATAAADGINRHLDRKSRGAEKLELSHLARPSQES